MLRRDVRSIQVSDRGATKSDRVGGLSYAASRALRPTQERLSVTDLRREDEDYSESPPGRYHAWC
jgi:hypothetical protein